MRKLATFCLLAALAFAAALAFDAAEARTRHAGTGGAATARSALTDDSASRVLHVNARATGPVHERLVLALNKAAVVELDTDARDVLVSSPDIVDAVVRTPRRVFLLALKTGQTNAFFFDGQGRQILSVDIRVERDMADLGTMLHENMPGSDIHVSALNDNVVLTGTVRDAGESARAQDLAARFATEAGKPTDATKVVNMLRVQSSGQVMLKVRVAEMQRQIAKQFGFNIAAAGVVDNIPLAIATDNQFGLLGRALSDIAGAQAGQVCSSTSTAGNPIGALNGGGVCNIRNNAQAQFKALETVGLMHTLAEPNLTAVSGETAKFLAGGEFPVPTARDRDGNVTIVFKQFGVGLSFTPIVLGSGRISLQISSEVSELTNTGAFTVAGANGGSGLTIPALAVRRAETTVELPSGGSFAIAGLMQHTTKQAIDAFPGLKEMPVLGALFRSRDFQNDETELVVLVSAYLVNPTVETKLAAPTDGFQAPSDIQTILQGKLNAIYKHAPAPSTNLAAGSVGFIVR